jgi:hypothetical protein
MQSTCGFEEVPIEKIDLAITGHRRKIIYYDDFIGIVVLLFLFFFFSFSSSSSAEVLFSSSCNIPSHQNLL